MNQKIVIIGGGASGIAAATKLIANGFINLTILEAEPRIGGRVNTVPFGAGVAELGAQYCHGNRNNAVYDLANKHDLLMEMVLLNDAGNIPFFETNGTMIPMEKSKKLFQLGNHILENMEMTSYKGSLDNFFMEKYVHNSIILKTAYSSTKSKCINGEISLDTGKRSKMNRMATSTKNYAINFQNCSPDA